MGSSEQKILFYLIGLLVALLLGHLCVDTFLKFWRKKILIQAERSQEMSEYRELTQELVIKGWFVGLFERTIFFFLVATKIPNVMTLMGVWIGLKMLHNWGIVTKENKSRIARSLAFTTLLTNVVSMSFAYVGGSIFNRELFRYIPKLPSHIEFSSCFRNSIGLTLCFFGISMLIYYWLEIRRIKNTYGALSPSFWWLIIGLAGSISGVLFQLFAVWG